VQKEQIQDSSVYEVESTAVIVKEKILPLWEKGTIFALRGEIGAGKTTLSKELLRQLGVFDVVISPTYSYFCRYETTSGHSVYHFDLYRVESVEMFFELGFDEILFDIAHSMVVEWPEVISDLLQDDILRSRVVWIDILYDAKNPQKRDLVVSRFV